MYYVKAAFRLLILAGLAVAAFWSVRLAWADAWFRTGTVAGVERALSTAPNQPEYLATRALQMEYEGQDSRTLLERAAALSPMSSAPRIRLGLAAEIRGDLGSAERWLLESARVDQTFEPRWTLANFYFRAHRSRGDDDFWKWMRAALAISYGDRRPAFDLCRRVRDDAREILRRAIPPQAPVVAAYLSYLLEANWIGAAPEAPLTLASLDRDHQYRPLLLASCDGLIAAGSVAAAGDVWIALGESKPFGVTNPDFNAPHTGRCFDWRWPPARGLSHIPIQGALRIQLSGQQPESLEVLSQTLAGIEPGRSYQLMWESRTTGFKEPTGLQWRIATEAVAVPPSDYWQASSRIFGAPTESKAWSLALLYQRPQGQVRAEGSVELRHVRISPAP